MSLKDQWSACGELIEKQQECPNFQMTVPNGDAIQMTNVKSHGTDVEFIRAVWIRNQCKNG